MADLVAAATAAVGEDLHNLESEIQELLKDSKGFSNGKPVQEEDAEEIIHLA